MSWIETGTQRLDAALGGGVLRGAITVVTGEPGCGKTALALEAAATALGMGRAVALVGSGDSPGRAPAGVWLGRHEGCQEALRMAGLLAVSGAFDLVVVDEVAEVDAASLRRLRHCCGEGGCAVLIVARAALFGRTPLPLSLAAAARVDLQRDGRARIVSSGETRWCGLVPR